MAYPTMGKATLVPVPLSLHHRNLFQRYFGRYRCEVSDLSFPSLFIWRHAFHASVVEEHDSLCVFCRRNGRLFALPPIGPVEALPKLIPAIQRFFEAQGLPFIMKAVPESLLKAITIAYPGDLKVTSDPGTWDYVYRTADLIDLPGRKLQSRRNHLNKFLSTYEFEYVSLSPAIAGECLALDRLWRNNHQSAGLMDEEEQAVHEALSHCGELGLSGGAIRIAGQIRAFAAGARLSPDTAVCHIEKADRDFAGLYAAINQQTAQHAWADTTFINREEDMGLPGLHRAKQAYCPEHMVKKFDLAAE